ncbi:MAG: hypothetical protein AAFO69_15725, partial [Bacteroidota bacterium]
QFFKTYDRRLMRLTWNDRGWQYPMGHDWSQAKQGVSTNKHENQYGYAHEEWLFNRQFQLDGFQYGYIRGVHNMPKSAEHIDEVVLFTIDPASKQRYLVGRVLDVEIIEDYQPEIDKFQPVYDSLKKEMISQLQEVEADDKYFREHALFPNVRFRWENLHIYDPLLPTELVDPHKHTRFGAYKLTEDMEEMVESLEIDPSLVFQSGRGKVAHHYVQTTKAGKRQVYKLHSEITNTLYDYLHQVDGYDEQMLSEEKTRVAGGIVDLVVNREGRLRLFEVKTHHTAMANIREALGQLLEYALLDASIELEQLIIVGPAKMKQAEQEYLERLKELIQVNLSYWFYNSAAAELSDRFVQEG